MDATSIDMIVGSLAGSISSGGGFCTGATLMVEHQRLNSPAVTFSASLPTFLATTASEVISQFQSDEGAQMLKVLQDRTGTLRRQLLRSEWVHCASAVQNPVIVLSLRDEHVREKDLLLSEQERLLQECVNEVRGFLKLSVHNRNSLISSLQCLSKYNILITRLKSLPLMEGLSARDVDKEWLPKPALKICVSSALSQKEIEKAGAGIRHAIAAVMKRQK